MEVAKGQSHEHRRLIAVSWVLLGLLLGSLLALSYWFEPQPVPWLALGSWFLGWLLWLPLGGLLERLVRVRPIESRTWSLRVPPYVLGGLLVAATLLTLRLLTDRGLHLIFDAEGHASTVGAFLVQSVIIDALIYTGIVATTHALDYHRRYSQRLLQSAELESRLSRVRVAFLRNQMQPHFLLNTLNLISALIHSQPDKADTMIADLGDLLRLTLEDSRRQEVPLRRELQYLEHYLDIARTRFGSALDVDRRIDPGLEEVMVPSLLLQPLVENSLRYGLAERNGKSRITISASRHADRIRLEVGDNGRGLPSDALGSMRMGLGLGNTRRRLEQLYGNAHRLEIHNRPEGGALAVLEIPLRLSSSSPDNSEPESGIYDHSHSYRRRRASGA
jgi:signal transduction histidine kinase